MGHIWLIGMMGSGKTSVGIKVSELTGLPFIDADDHVVEISGRTIPELFDIGETAFRDAERRAIADIASQPGHVVATGGGAILDEGNVAIMRRTGTTVLLDTDPAELVRRLDDPTGRPLLVAGRDLATIAIERAALYAAGADAVVETTGKSVDEVSKEVAACAGM